MTQALPTMFVDDNAQAALATRVPDAVEGTGMTAGGSNSPGIGISTETTDLQDSLFEATDGSGNLTTGSWTELDQNEDPRTPQIGQHIGGSGISSPSESDGTEGTLPDAPVRFGANPDNVDGQPDNDDVITAGQGATLSSLSTGWEEAVESPPE